MAEENFLLVSLKEDEAKRLAQVISNDTSRKILDFLASRKDATETDIGKHLKLPLSTVHYNMHALLQAKLVQCDEFHYSEKGKEVNHYSLANKYVIIAPKEATESLKTKLRRILPVAAITLAATGLIQLFSRFNTYSGEETVAPLQAAFPMAEKAVADTAVRNIAQAQPWFMANMSLWFLYGALFTIIVFVLVDWIQRRK
jgi:DNA-binding transcriptional ArsR family regulator